VDGSDSQAIRLPILKPEQNLVERKATFQLAADGSLAGNVTESRGGDIARAWREIPVDARKEQEQTLNRSLSANLVGFHADDLKLTNADELEKNLSLSYSLKVDHFAQPMGALLAVRPHVLGSDGLAVDAKPRVLPIDLGMTRQTRDDFTITLPAGIEVDELPPPVNVDLGFAAYQSASTVENHAIHYSRTYTVREITLPADRYGDVQKMARVIAGDEQSSAVLKHVN
jgi:hypothetical protein